MTRVDASAKKIKTLLLICMLAFTGFDAFSASTNRTAKPNIVFILADDLGYGDVKCFNSDGKIPTPNLDRLASEGMRFTDAHSSSAVCTPTRYSILTGRYNWRSRLKSGVLQGYSPRLIEPGRLTVSAFLQQRGFATACIGKWHLGMDWPLKDGKFAKGINDAATVDYAKPIQGGPNAVGFDHFFGISASLDMPPFVFIENDRVAEMPTAEKKWIRAGPAGESFEAENVLPRLTTKAADYIAQHAAATKQRKPFFLYLALNSPHTPILPTKEWRGKSGLNDYADFVMETDASIGRVLVELDKQGIADNTLVIMTSDNGCSPAAKFPELLAKGHNPSYHFRGTKADIFDGGNRVPLIVRWPNRIKPGSTSGQLVCLVDFFRTCAEILGEKLPDTAAEDSVSLLPTLEGRTNSAVRETIVHHSINGSFSIREGKWKLELCADSGGWSDPKPGSVAAKTLSAIQLYDLSRDIGEKENVADKNPDIVRRLTATLEKYVANGRSTPGSPQANAGTVEIRRRGNQTDGD
jgi:arylsulfatase A-like enzyme